MFTVRRPVLHVAFKMGASVPARYGALKSYATPLTLIKLHTRDVAGVETICHLKRELHRFGSRITVRVCARSSHREKLYDQLLREDELHGVLWISSLKFSHYKSLAISSVYLEVTRFITLLGIVLNFQIYLFYDKSRRRLKYTMKVLYVSFRTRPRL